MSARRPVDLAAVVAELDKIRAALHAYPTMAVRTAAFLDADAPDLDALEAPVHKDKTVPVRFDLDQYQRAARLVPVLGEADRLKPYGHKTSTAAALRLAVDLGLASLERKYRAELAALDSDTTPEEG